jgi:starch synthase
MFSFFSRSVVEFVKTEFNTYDIVHCNDWHTGLITHLLESELGQERPRTLFTIHNLMYQGVGEPDLAREVGITPGEHPLVDWDLEDNKLNLMLQGVTSSDYINAVSPTYAKEILTEQYGGALADILKNREGRLTGILNGIDTNAFPRYYDVSDWQTGKVQARQSLLIKLGLKDNDKPIFSFISRLDPNQKGLDILLEVIPEIISRGGRFVLLGAGDRAWEQKFLTLAGEDVAIRIAFDNALACDIYAGSSFLLVPSRYEPCGLIQMIAMWYGTLPIVHNVGGLKDSVSNGVNGFVFEEHSGDSAKKSVKDAMKMYNSNSTDYGQMVVNAMKTDFSWGKSAEEYLKLYERML